MTVFQCTSCGGQGEAEENASVGTCPYCGRKISLRQEENVASPKESETAAWLRRAFLCLEDREFSKADALLEAVLNQEPENAQAYLGKLLVERRTATLDAAVSQRLWFLENQESYQKALRFSTGEEHERIAALGRENQKQVLSDYLNRARNCQGTE